MKDCYDCEFAEFDTEEYYGGKQKIVSGCKNPEFCSNQLQVGDYIKCKSGADMWNTMLELNKHGVKHEVRNERNGVKGFWLEVISIDD